MSGKLPRLIAIDGPAAAGKTSLGLALAARLGYRFLDTGLMYRAFALAALRAGLAQGDAHGCAELARSLSLRFVSDPDGGRILLDGRDVTSELRGPAVEATVSGYSAIPDVRKEMVRRQRRVASRGSAILAGRDIGTVVLPRAPLKIYLVASEDVRAKRRAVQSRQWGTRRALPAARDDIGARDRIDSTREVGPLTPAPGALVIDTTAQTPEETLKIVLGHFGCAG